MRYVFKSEFLFFTSFFFFSSVCVGQFSVPNHKQLESYLKTGEFSAANNLVKTAESDQEKDRILAEIARAQQKNGLTTQSLSTIARMGSDIARSASLDQFKRSGFGSKLGEGLDWEANREGNRRTANGAGGGAAMADFDPLIELIQNTIDPQSWMDTNGGPGTINEFRAGVTVDAEGVLQKVDYSIKQGILKDILKESSRKSTNLNVFKDSELRKISLNRLEKKCQILAAAGKSPSEVMERLAGIYEIKYLLVYPESGDIVIAGPGGDWRTDVEGVAVNIKTGRPLFRLDDLVVCLRNAIEFNGKFGCSIDPRQANLIATQQFASTSDLKGKRWREGLQNALGFQDITVDGIDPQSVVARVIVEADYRMKLVGVGLEKSVPGVESFLSKVSLDADGNVPPTDVMRLEFMLNYDNISVTEDKDAYQLHGQGVKVVSEKELLNQKGERFQTGKSEGPAAEFARGFTKHFPAMAKRYPIYAQLKNVFDLAMVSNLIRSQGIDKICKWNMTYFGPEKNSQQTYLSRKGSIPREVKSVMNYREIDVRENGRTIKTQLIVGISGGVSVDVEKLIQSREMIKKDTYGKLKIDRKIAKPTAENWWWD